MMRSRVWVACVLLVVAAGCVTATPPKTPNQREVERRAADNDREDTVEPSREVPPAIKR